MTLYNVVSPGAMQEGQPEDISVILANFNAIAAVINGALDNGNLGAAAAIAISKLAGFPNDPSKALLGDGSWGAGGSSLAMKGDWAAPSTYQDGDVVVYNGIAYMCLTGPTTPGTPPNPLEWGLAAASVGYGTSFPASPVDGQEFILVDSLTAPTYQWRFRYNAGRTSDAFKWEFIGGPALWAEVATAEGTASASYVALATPGPSITLPRPGIYLVRPSMRLNATDIGGAMSYDIGATAAVDADACHGVPRGSSIGQSCMAERRKTIATAVTLTAKYRATAGSPAFGDRRLTVEPVAVS